MARHLRYASIEAEVVNVRYRTPASYQSRPAHPPSPAAVKAAIARAAAQIGGEEAWMGIISGVVWGTYSILKPFSSVTYLVSRLQPPEQRKRSKQKRIASADPAKQGFKKPSNVFPVGEYLSGEFRIVAIYDAGKVPDELVVKSLLGLNILGDNDSIVTPKPSTLRSGSVNVAGGSEVGVATTSYVFRLRDATPTKGSWLLAKLPTVIRPRGFREVVRLERPVFEEVVIPAKRLGQVLFPQEVIVRLSKGIAVTLGDEGYVILPKGGA